jgi:hypothetical protein
MKFLTRTLLSHIPKWGVILVLVLPMLLIACWFAKPAKALPPPVVALDFIKFSLDGTNPIAIYSFTNLGQTEVCLWESIELWRLVAETPTGRITDTPPFASVTGDGVPPGSNRIFAVPIPSGTTRWQLSTIYGFDKKRHAPTEFRGWVWRSWLVQRSPGPVSDAIAWCLDLLPSGPHPEHGEICTPIMTKLPPSL